MKSLSYFIISSAGYEPWLMHLKPDTHCSNSWTFTMTLFTSKLCDDFLRVLKLTLDRKIWVIYKGRLTLSVQAHGLSRYCMILINSTSYRDRDMPDEILHSSVGRMTRDKVRVSSAGHDRQLEDLERTMAIYHLWRWQSLSITRSWNWRTKTVSAPTRSRD